MSRASGPLTIFSLAGPGAALALATLRGQLEALHQAGEAAKDVKARTELTLQCKVCHRPVAWVVPHFSFGRLHLTLRDGQAPRNATDPASPMVERYVLSCHRRCCDPDTHWPTQIVVRPDRLVPEYVRAVRAGERSVLVPLQN